jgi:hypothetical protein
MAQKRTDEYRDGPSLRQGRSPRERDPAGPTAALLQPCPSGEYSCAASQEMASYRHSPIVGRLGIG